MLHEIFSYIKLSFEITKLNILSAMEYRVSFLIQTVGMFINDIGLILVWGIFFSRFPAINGWHLSDTYMLFALSMTNFGIFRIFAGGTEEISSTIIQGELDYYMTLPKSVLWQVSTSQSNISALGDILFGYGLFLFFCHPSFSGFLWFVFLSSFTALILYNFTVILHSLSFYFENFEETADRAFNLLVGLVLYPESTFTGILRFVSIIILPAFFISWAPVNIISKFSWEKLLLIFGFWLVTVIIAVRFFNRGLKRYESGNLINLKM